MSSRDTILLDIVAERFRQERLCREGKFIATLATPPADGGHGPAACLAVLAEEFGEVARPVADALAGAAFDTAAVREELIQLAACCVAWVEQLDGVPQMGRPYTDRPRPAVPGYLEDPFVDGLFPAAIQEAS